MSCPVRPAWHLVERCDRDQKVIGVPDCQPTTASGLDITDAGITHELELSAASITVPPEDARVLHVKVD
jgi:hypothetical protein